MEFRHFEVLKTSCKQQERESVPHRHEQELHPRGCFAQHLLEVPRLSDDGWLHGAFALLLCILLQYRLVPAHVRASWGVLLGEEDVQGETAASYWLTPLKGHQSDTILTV